MAKPIRALELHYPMIQFEIIRIIRYGEWVIYIWLDTKTSFRHLDLKALNIWILPSKSNNRQSAVGLLSIYYFYIHSITYVFTRNLNSNPIHSRGILWNKDLHFRWIKDQSTSSLYWLKSINSYLEYWPTILHSLF